MANADSRLMHDVIQRHRAWLVRLIASRTGSQALVDDILQEIGLAVAQSANRPTQEAGVAPWLCTIAIRQCALALRKGQRQQRLVQGAASNKGSSASGLDDPVYWLLARERSTLVREALKEMDAEKRSLLIRKYVDGMTFGQLAARMGVAAHVVEYRVATAKRNLRTLLIERGLDQEDLT